MPSIVDAFPYPWESPEARELHRVLTELYPTERRAVSVAQSVGLPEYELASGISAHFIWREILELGAKKAINRKLVEFVRDQNATNPSRSFLEATLAGAPTPVSSEPREEDGSALFLSGSEAITEKEALLFRDDLTFLVGRLPAFVETVRKMMDLSPAVCLLHVNAGPRLSNGTGFLIGKDLILTNHHVLFPNGHKATQVIAEFGFETNEKDEGLPSKSVTCPCDSIVADATDDWGVIRIHGGTDLAGPIVNLAQAAVPCIGEPAYILQHPLGGRKRLGFVRNTVTGFNDRVVHYLTDTQRGSSGSPVFNARGELIALHHSGGTPQDVTGKMPLLKNEGMRIPRIHHALVAQGLLAS